MSEDRGQLLIRDLGALLGVPDLALDADGMCTLSTEECPDVVISYFSQASRFTLSSDLGRIEGDEESTLPSLLQANLDWMSSQGAVLTLRGKQKDDVSLQLAICTESLEHHALHGRVIGFMKFAAHWRRNLTAAPEAGAPDSEPASLMIDPSRLV